MKDKRNIFIFMAVLVLLAVLLFLFTGNGIDRKDTTPAPEATTEVTLRMEADELQKANRALFENLALDGKIIYVIGHKSPDTDTVGSAIAYSELLNRLGYRSEPRIASEKINNETKYVLEKCGLSVPEFLSDAAGQTLYLVDHNELIQAADGAEEAEIIGILDHHTINCSTGAIIKVRSENVGATATLVALDYESYGVDISPAIAKMIAYTILSDSENFQKNTTTSADRIVYKKMAEIGGLQNANAVYREMEAAKASYEGMTDTEIYFSDYKEYFVNNYTYAIPTFRSKDSATALELGRRMTIIMAEQYKSGAYDFIFSKIKDEKTDTAYLFVYGDGAENICKRAFPNAVFNGRYFLVRPSISRKSVMVPAINTVLESLLSSAA